MRLKKVRFKIPEEYLERFDKTIQGYYASRSEAIRAGMNLILESLTQTRKD